VTVNPEVMVGKPVIQGTRIPVAMILRMMGQSISPEAILGAYRSMERADIDAALTYAAQVLERQDVRSLLRQGRDISLDDC
jgi:uncharacterized protein (DUF433 family)